MDAGKLIKSLKAVSDNLTKELGIVAWKAARPAKALISKEVTKELAVPQKIVKSKIWTKKVGKTGAAIQLDKSKRIELRDFGARQTKKGVSYKISKSKGRSTIRQAFKGPRPGLTFAKHKGSVFGRVGESRKPIAKLYGPSPWGVFQKQKLSVPVRKKIETELEKQMVERIRFRTLKKSGAI